ncbi:hypothetical protein [Neobacillus niacini]|uniref:hypothetical protein n=1 Tax=Neobacillus niacini TaxID=86668 RepID=UPI001C8E69D4|nr:hypothetical protein [Neobacillus niacini]MBY0148724.1 hypothetical protein [Neobacillus niacini]
MVEIIKEVLAKFGLPGIIFSLIYILMKMNPITLISASHVEFKFFTKEKRFYIKGIKTLSEILFYLLLLWMITDQFFSDKELYNPKLMMTITIITFVLFSVIFVFDFVGKSFIDLFGEIKKGYQIIVYILFLFYGFSWLLLPAYYIGTQIYSEFYNEKLTNIEQYGVLVAVLFFYLILIIFVYFTVIKTLYNFLDFNSDNIQSLTIEVNGKRWYIFHPTENEFFLLGNKPILKQCTEFSFIEKNELMTNIIMVEE